MMTLAEKIERLANRELRYVSCDMHLDLNGKFLELPIQVGDDIVEGVLCNRYQGNGYLVAASPQVGCPVGCKFCDMSDIGYHGNLSGEIILEQVALVLNRARRFGYEITKKPLKISFVKGGEGLLNREFPHGLELIAENLPVPMKVSTTFPDSKVAHEVYGRIEKFTSGYCETVQMQISLISTDKGYRQGMTRMPLISFDGLREYAESWQKNVKNPRKFTLSFTLNEKTPCNPEEIYDKLPPELFAVRIRNWLPTIPGLKEGLLKPEEKTAIDIANRFRDFGYTLIPGKPGATESKFNLAAGHIIKMYKGLMKR
ncbi:hypothetical protein COV93_07885 [Candidatus Woesearchaeota archaeon CG11_big_fil_rev_8_21_14_0_20_43_8]|nr:MAG: hypothetical protein COV93_07885 [Candidatus Woesearchaeota archaeon CG11_big_fil_rev_8_21_14_0_20_43_8]